MSKHLICTATLFITLFILVGCNSDIEKQSLQIENRQLKIEIDSLKNELHKCEMLMESYEGMPLNI